MVGKDRNRQAHTVESRERRKAKDKIIKWKRGIRTRIRNTERVSGVRLKRHRQDIIESKEVSGRK